MKKIGFWMYNNDGGSIIQNKLKNILEANGFEVINNFDMRNCYCLNGEIYTEDGNNLTKLDLLFHMNADERSDYQNDILRALSLSGVKMINPFKNYELTRDKFSANLLLRNNGINVPPSLLISNNFDREIIKNLFNKWHEVLVKPRRGHCGTGIVKINNYESFIDYYLSVRDFISQYYIEKFIPFSEHDYRIEIIDNKIVGGYSRKRNHTFKTNVGSGGTMIESPGDNSPFKEIALKATQICGLSVTIVDMIKSTEDNKIYVLEVNDSMGIFAETALKAGFGSAKDGILKSFSYDDKKVEMLANYIIEISKKQELK